MAGKQRLINVRTVDGLMQVSARCFGAIAAHPQLLAGGLSHTGWSVTHIPSGVCFSPTFPSKEVAFEAAKEIDALRDDWAIFEPARVDEKFLTVLKALYKKYDAVWLPPPDGDRRRKLAKQQYATDLNGYQPSNGLPRPNDDR